MRKIDGNNVELTLGNNSTVVVNSNVYQLYQDPAIAEGFRRVTNPLRQAEIDRIVVKQDGSEQVAIDKGEAKYFETDTFALEAATSPMEGEHEAVLIVSKVSFVEGTTWTFIENGATLTAKIEDPEFWINVHRNDLRFGEGDSLRVLLHWKVVQNRARKLVPKNTILKVHKVLPRARNVQLSLEDSLERPARRFRTDDDDA